MDEHELTGKIDKHEFFGKLVEWLHGCVVPNLQSTYEYISGIQQSEFGMSLIETLNKILSVLVDFELGGLENFNPTEHLGKELQDMQNLCSALPPVEDWDAFQQWLLLLARFLDQLADAFEKEDKHLAFLLRLLAWLIRKIVEKY